MLNGNLFNFVILYNMNLCRTKWTFWTFNQYFFKFCNLLIVFFVLNYRIILWTRWICNASTTTLQHDPKGGYSQVRKWTNKNITRRTVTYTKEDIYKMDELIFGQGELEVLLVNVQAKGDWMKLLYWNWETTTL